MKIYLAGPFRGYPQWNFPAFDRLKLEWEAEGHHVFSPADSARAYGYDENGPEPDRDHLRHVMLVDLATVGASDAVAVLPGWKESLGAKMEVAAAQFLGLPIYDAVTKERVNGIQVQKCE